MTKPDTRAPKVSFTWGDPQEIAEVIAFQEEWVRILNDDETYRKDVAIGLERIYSQTDDMHMFDLFRRDITGAKEYVEHYWGIAAEYRDASMEFWDLRVHAKGGIAFCSMQQDYRGKDQSGNEFHFLLRCTDGLLKENGEWRIVEEHFSFPCDLETKQARFTTSKRGLYRGRAVITTADSTSS